MGGWGGTEAEEEGTRVLQMMKYSVSDQEECAEYWKTRGKPIMEGMFCTGSPDEDQHAWAGDEGGPVLVNQNGDLVQAGLVSWGNDRTVPREYDVNTDLVHFKEWIEEQAASTENYPWIELGGGLSHGVARGSRDYTGRRPSKGFSKMPQFGATKLQCTEGTDDFAGECAYLKYPDEAPMPCFDGQQLAVQCANEEWTFQFTHMQTKTGDRGKAMCRLDAQQYGAQINVKSEVTAMLVNIKEDGVDVVGEAMKYRKKQSSFTARFKDIEHSCLACVAMMNGAESHFNTYHLEHQDICKLSETDAEEALKKWIEEYVPEDKGGNRSEN